ncbi:serine hydrolase [Sphingomonas sp. BLCC-B65]|nr:serine hydrolase [Sphingomonas sp. BLCC-B65]
MIDALTTALGDLMTLHVGHVPGAALAVHLSDETRTLTQGRTSSTGGEPITDRTVFRWCSITKLATTEVVLQLADEQPGLLDTALGDLLPGPAHAAFADVTVRMALMHTSGIEGEWPESLDVFGEDAGALERFVAEAPTLRRFARPGRVYGYCNPGFWLLAASVERLAGAAFEYLLRERVLDPLHLADTRSETERPTLRPASCAPALPHLRDGEGVRPHDPRPMPRTRVASGGLSGSIGDLLRFGVAMLDHPTRLTQASQTMVPRGGPGAYQGLGWEIDRGENGTALGHSGFYEGFSSHLLVVPARRAVVAVLGNSDAAWELCESIVDLTERHLLGPLQAEPKEPALPAASYSGHFGFPGMDDVELAVEGDLIEIGLLPRGGRPSRVHGHAAGPDRFVLDDGPAVGETLRLLDGGIGYRTFRLGGRLGGRNVS